MYFFVWKPKWGRGGASLVIQAICIHCFVAGIKRSHYSPQKNHLPYLIFWVAIYSNCLLWSFIEQIKRLSFNLFLTISCYSNFTKITTSFTKFLFQNILILAQGLSLPRLLTSETFVLDVWYSPDKKGLLFTGILFHYEKKFTKSMSFGIN